MSENNASPEAPAAARARMRRWLLLLLLSAIMGMGPLATNFYLPAMPIMSRTLGAQHGELELTISGYLVGFSFGQLVWGPIGDRYGRRGPMAVGLMLFIVASAGCALSTEASQVILWRMVQSLGACAGMVLGRAIVRDLYEGDRAAQMMSTLVSVIAIAPLVGPIAGGQILKFAPWQGIFWALVSIGAVALFGISRTSETLPRERRNTEPPARVFADYWRFLKNRRVIGYAVAGSFFYCGIYAYIAGTPFAYIQYYHMSADLYGLLFAVNIVSYMLTNMLNARVVRQAGGARMLLVGAVIAAVSGVALACAATTGAFGVWGLIAPLFVFISATGFIVANSVAGAMAPFPDRAGAVSALIGALHYTGGIVGSVLVSAFADGTPSALGWVVAFSGAGAAISAWLLVPRERVAGDL